MSELTNKNCIKNQNWLQVLFHVEAPFQNSKYQNFICKLNAQMLAITFMSVRACHKYNS